MFAYLVRRLLYTILLLIGVSIFSFLIIQAPPGDFVSTMIVRLEAQGGAIDKAQIAALRRRYGLDRALPVQYWMWMQGIIVRGDLGYSFDWGEPVKDLLADRIGPTLIVSLTSILVTYVLAIPVGIYSATHQYSVGDYALTFLGFLGIAVPHFVIALVFMFVAFKYLGLSPGGLFSAEYLDTSWSWARVVDLLSHLPVPLAILGLGGIAGTMRIMRANLLDQLGRPYVMAARAKGLHERKLLYKYPVRYALNPVASGIGWIFRSIVSGAAITGIVLNLPTIGPLLLRALKAQDMYLAGSLLMVLCVVTVAGMFVSDIVLAWLDPRIRFE